MILGILIFHCQDFLAADDDGECVLKLETDKMDVRQPDFVKSNIHDRINAGLENLMKQRSNYEFDDSLPEYLSCVNQVIAGGLLHCV